MLDMPPKGTKKVRLDIRICANKTYARAFVLAVFCDADSLTCPDHLNSSVGQTSSMAGSVRFDVKNQTAQYNSSSNKVDELVDQTAELSCIVEIRSQQRVGSAACKNCESKHRKAQRQTIYARIRSYILAGRNIEAKLKRFNVKSHRGTNPFGFLRKLFGAMFQKETDMKFTAEELEKLTECQLGELKEALQKIVADKRKELQQEKLARIGETESLEKSKQKAKEVENMAWVTLKPFINDHPSNDLTRVLMF